MQGIGFITIELFALAVIGLVWVRERVLFDVHAHQRTLITWTSIAVALETVGRRGPFEWLHRRLSYGAAWRIEQNEASR